MPQLRSRKKVLIVEDDHDFSVKLSSLVSSILNAHVVCASEGLSAVEKLKKDTFDVVVSDVRMPKMDGLELLCCTRKLGIETPFILLSAYTDKYMALRALKLGAIDFLEKPFQVEELVNSIEKIVTKNAAMIQKFNYSTLGLKETQRKVVEQLIAGQSNKSIGLSLGLSEPSIKYHIGMLLEKYEAKNRDDLRAKILSILMDETH